MADGVPMFGQRGDNGTVPTDLDQCQGHVDASYPYYHYHLPEGRSFPFTTACLMGCVDLNVFTFTNPVNPPYVGSDCSDVADKQYDYSSVKGLFAAAIQNKTAAAPTFVFYEYVASTTQTEASSPPPPSPTSHHKPPQRKPPQRKPPHRKPPPRRIGL